MVRKTTVGACLIILLALVLSVYTFRAPILTAVGRLLVVADPLDSSDVIVVTTDAGEAGILEASDLVHRGTASQVAVFDTPPDKVDSELKRRGVPYFDVAALLIRQLNGLGVTYVVKIPLEALGTHNESHALSGWLKRHRFRSVVLVTETEHSRRSRRIFRRALKGQLINLYVQPSHYSSFNPENWWKSRHNLKTGIIELQKLVVDLLFHPIS